MIDKVTLNFFIQLFISILFSFLILLNIQSNLTIDFLMYSIVIIYFWIVISSIQVGFPLTHPYLIFLYSVFGFIVWTVFFTSIGVVNLQGNFWLGNFLFSDEKIIIQSFQLVLLFLLFTHLGALYHKKKNIDNCFMNKIPNVSDELLLNTRKQSKFLFYLSIPFFTIYVLSYVIAVFKYGYFILFDPDKFFKVPAWLGLADDLTRTFFWLYIATKPDLKESKKIITIYSFITLISLGIGQRGIVFAEFFAIIASLSYLGYKMPIKSLTMFGMILILLSPIIETQRVNGLHDDEYFTSMISSQGLPLLSIPAALLYEQDLPPNKYKYIYGPFTEFANSFSSKSTYYNENNLPRLPQVLTYKIDDNSFNSGWGMGNSIISEFYIFGGIIGLSLLSFLYPILFLNFFDKYNSFFAIFISFISMRMFIFTVRENPTYIIVSNLYSIIIFVIFWIYIKTKTVKSA